MIDLTKLGAWLLEAQPTEQPTTEAPVPSLADLLAEVVEGLRALRQPAPAQLKGTAVRMFSRQTLNALSDKAADCRGVNGVHVEVLVSGTSPSATISVEGGIEEGSAGYMALPDPASNRTGVAANLSFDCVVGSAWAKVRVSSISGTFGDGEGYTITVTPFRMGTPGSGLLPRVSGGLSIYRLLSAASTNGNNIKASAGQVYGWFISNTNAAARVVKLYNTAGTPTVGTDTPVMTLLIPGNTAGAGTNISFEMGIAFALGIGIGITTGVADNDVAAVAANEVIVNLFYK